MSERLVTARELAETVGVSAATVIKRWERGNLHGFKLWNGPVRLRTSGPAG